MKKRNLLYMLGAAVVLLLAFSCSKITRVTDAITNPTAREVYAREFKGQEMAIGQWEAAYKDALSDSIEISLPYGEKGKFSPSQNLAYSYTFKLQEGKSITAEVLRDSLNHKIFMDIFEWDGNAYRLVESGKMGDYSLAYTPESSGTYKLVIQPEIVANTDFALVINEQPAYGFPVAGKGNSAIQSFWGMERDGGKRKHEGIDIFAKKGTPVVAAVDGYIGYTGERGLGGKQVWLREGIFGNSLYYAHLDEIAVASGTRVKAGDTLGFVGNTGNAKFTPPHLHFGIYKGYGAVDPLPYVHVTEKLTASKFPRSFDSNVLKVKGKANLRQGPSTEAPRIGELGANETVVLMGQNKDWLHVKTATNMKAFLHKSLVKEVR